MATYNPIKSALSNALATVKTFNSANLIAANNHSASVYKSFVVNSSRDMQLDGFQNRDDMMIMGTPEDIAPLNLVPGKTRVTLDGAVYVVGRTITNTPGYVSVWLRLP